MKLVTYSMGMTLDGYIVGPDGGFDWGAPDAEEFRASIDEIRGIDVHLLGRRLHETMVYWEDPEQATSWDDAEREWADLWNALPKVVFSRTLSSVDASNTRLATVGLAEEIERLRAEPGDGDIAIGGATLAAAAAELGLIDEYRVRVSPVLVGGGIPYFPPTQRQVDLELLDTRTFATGAVALRYRVRR
ncbi:dihydrofolate reductase [Curtobacterium sp. PhB130]|uniref:dihydrofolate reductase family protein n=1 Tax=unclassified Curtobacterium TaxID=257496 RepID=UPI000F4AFE46|nr:MULTISPECIES: dihydrofolate reductase family protein [unclassified Curtobacterium]ROS77990.1 dihydrofolate reductase [Curtobacterium sp. PhB130]TCK65695.1 dihydrofolate reductase [Curtobacterium sp. PhB136]